MIFVIVWQHGRGTNKCVKWMILGPKDEVQSPSKIRSEETTQTNVELDEFSMKKGVSWTETMKI